MHLACGFSSVQKKLDLHQLEKAKHTVKTEKTNTGIHSEPILLRDKSYR